MLIATGGICVATAAGVSAAAAGVAADATDDETDDTATCGAVSIPRKQRHKQRATVGTRTSVRPIT